MRLSLPGADTDYVSTPDSAGLSVTGDLDLRVMVALDDWFDVAVDAQVLIAKWDTGGFSYSFHVNNTGGMVLQWTEDNSTVKSAVATATLPACDGDEPLWCRATLDVDNGASGHTARFYTSYDGTVWRQVGDDAVGSGTTSIYDGTTAVLVGARGSDGFPCTGSIYKAQIYDGIDGTERANLDFTDADQGWVVGDDAGDTGSDGTNTWTIAGAATVQDDPETLHGTALFVAAALGSNPITEEPIWTDITADVRHVEFSRGRQYELDRIDAGTMTVLLSNAHGNYNAHNTAGDYYPNIKPTVPIRVHAYRDGTVYPLWQGFVERWPVSFPAQGKDSVVQVECVDLFKLLALAKAAPADRESAVNDLSPVAWWRFSGDPGTADETGNSHTLTFNGSPTLEQTGAWQGDEAVTFDGSNDYATVASEDDVIREGEAVSWEFWLNPSGSDIDIVWRCGIARVFWLGATEEIGNAAFGGFGEAAADQWHHYVITTDGSGNWTSYLNGTLIGNASGLLLDEDDTVYIGSNAGAVQFFDGSFSEIAVYPSELTAAEVQGLYAASTEAYQDELTSARIAYLLDNFAFPVSPPQNLETGQSTIDGPNSPTDQTLLEAIRVAEETENGLFFMNAAGEAVFQDRYYRSDDQGTANATFGPANLPYVTVAGFGVDDERVLNDIRVAPDDSSDPFVVVNQTSVESHGRRTLERTIYPANANEALDAAYWLANLYGTPRTRIDSLGFRLGDDADLWDPILAAEISTRYTVKVPLSGDDFDEDMYLEGVSHSIDVHGEWDVTFSLSLANDFTVWVLDDDNLSILDDTTVLAY